MPRLHGVLERNDHVLFDTHRMEPGQVIRAFGADCPLGDGSRTNMRLPGYMAADQTLTILAIGLRIVGTTRDQEDPLLDHFRARLLLNGREYGPWPGSLLSTLRYANEEDQIHINALGDGEDEVSPERIRRFFIPGHVLQRPIAVPTRMRFELEVAAAGAPDGAPFRVAPPFAGSLVVRPMLFTLRMRDAT